MPKITSILCPVDFSEFSVNAYEYAQSIASHYNAKLVLQYVMYMWLEPLGDWDVYPDSFHEEERRKRHDKAEHQLQKFATRHSRTPVIPQLIVQDGPPTDLIFAQAEAQAADLIVIGTHGYMGIDQMMLGSVTNRVLRKARCPVLAVRKPALHLASSRHDPEPVSLRKMLLCMDFSDHAHHALKYARSLAKEYDAELTLLHVMEDIPESTDLECATGKIMERLQEFIPQESVAGCSVKAAVRLGKPYQQIVQFALEGQMDLVIMGVRGRDSIDSAIFGSTAYRVTQLGPCAVLAIHIL